VTSRALLMTEERSPSATRSIVRCLTLPRRCRTRAKPGVGRIAEALRTVSPAIAIRALLHREIERSWSCLVTFPARDEDARRRAHTRARRSLTGGVARQTVERALLRRRGRGHRTSISIGEPLRRLGATSVKGVPPRAIFRSPRTLPPEVGETERGPSAAAGQNTRTRHNP